MSYGELVERHGLSASHRLVLEAAPTGARVLDVGCASGHLAAALVAAKACTVVGVERDQRAASEARARGIEVREQDIELEPLDVQGFDCVVFADVLEHLRSPEATLRQAHAVGCVIVSLPNIAHWTGRRALLRGRFPREDFGLFDRTHLRFFTRASARALIREAGLELMEERFAPAPLPLQAHLPTLARFEQAAARWRPELFALQFVVSLVPASAA